MSRTNRNSPFLFLLLAIISQFLTWVAIYVLMNISFYPGSKFPEETASVLSAFFFLAGGFCGILFSTIGIYYTVLNKQLKVIIPIMFFLFIPVLFISTINFLAFFMLNAIL